MASFTTFVYVALALLAGAEATKGCWSVKDASIGIKCCRGGHDATEGDNVGAEGEFFIQEDKLLPAGNTTTPCVRTCWELEGDARGKPTGITESKDQFYSNGEHKCWCEFGIPKLDAANTGYQTCMFRNLRKTFMFGDLSFTVPADIKD